MRNFFGTILPLVSIIATPIVLAFFVYVGMEEAQYQRARVALLEERQAYYAGALASTSDQLARTTASLSSAIQIIEHNLSLSKSESAALADMLSATIAEEKEKVDAVGKEVAKITDTVGTLDKLSKTDPELLQKYSKVFFLNEHFAPARLAEIDKQYLYNEKRAQLFQADILPHLRAMLEAASSSGVKIFVSSAYRSFEEQQSLKTDYTVIYGQGSANTFSADQGYSEHQLGTTVDLITTGLGGLLPGFDKTPAFPWLQANAYKYGFILSYPASNSFYVYEPWHWRYVGVALATKLHDAGMNFYDMDQREIDAFLVSFFD